MRLALALAIIVGFLAFAVFHGTPLNHDSGACNGPHDSRWNAATSQCVELGQRAQEDSASTVAAYNEARAQCAQVDIERDTDHVLRVYAKACEGGVMRKQEDARQ